MFTSLRLERFKNFQDAELKLGPFTVLIGANASGKSNVRDAFRFLHGIGRGYRLPEIIGEKYGEGGELVWTGIRGGIPEVSFRKSRSFALRAEVLDDAALRHEIAVSLGGTVPSVIRSRPTGRRGLVRRHGALHAVRRNGARRAPYSGPSPHNQR